MVYVADEQTMISPPRGSEAGAELDRLGDEIAEIAAHVHAATYQLLVRLRVFDEQGGWGGGFRSCAHWLSWRTAIGLGTAREHVRVARALGELPQLSEAMRRGQLSFAKVRALTRIATPDNEKQLLELARQGTAQTRLECARGARNARMRSAHSSSSSSSSSRRRRSRRERTCVGREPNCVGEGSGM